MSHEDPYYQGATGYTPNSVPMVFIAFPRDSLGWNKTHKYPLRLDPKTMKNDGFRP